MLSPCRFTPLNLGLCALLYAGFGTAATTLPELSINASEAEADDPRVRDVTTATRTSTPAR